MVNVEDRRTALGGTGVRSYESQFARHDRDRNRESLPDGLHKLLGRARPVVGLGVENVCAVVVPHLKVIQIGGYVGSVGDGFEADNVTRDLLG